MRITVYIPDEDENELDIPFNIIFFIDQRPVPLQVKRGDTIKDIFEKLSSTIQGDLSKLMFFYLFFI